MAAATARTKAPERKKIVPRASCRRRRRRIAASSRGNATSRASNPMPTITARGSRLASHSIMRPDALAVWRDQVAAPQLAVAAHLDRPVALAGAAHRVVEPHDVLRLHSRPVHLARPFRHFAQHLDA